MKNQELPDITEARELLSKFEQTQDHRERLRHFEDGIELLDQFAEDDQDSDEGKLALNIRKTYTRKLIEELPFLGALDIDDWFSYSLILLMKVQNNVGALCTEQPALKTNFDNFIKMWSSEAIDIFSRHVKAP
jgi:hypothetical protein